MYYTSETNEREARPRSKRLRELGGSSAGGGSTVYAGGGTGSAGGDGHAHANKKYLDQITTDEEGYLYLTQLQDVPVVDEETGEETDETETIRVKRKVMAGHADLAHDLCNDSEVYNRFLRKDRDDRTEHGLEIVKLLSLLTGTASPDFLTGFLGSGFELRKNGESGRWRLEVDELMVRVVARFFEIIIHRLRHVGGSILLTPASMQCIRVEDTGDAYRCYFKKTDGERTVRQEFVVGDQARCQMFNLESVDGGGVGTQFYWRLVTGVGEDWIELSKSDCAANSGVPQVGDDIVQMGHRTDPERQNAILMETTGTDSPSIKQYKGICSYELTDEMLMTKIASDGNYLKGQFVSEAMGKDYDEAVREIAEQMNDIKVDVDAVKEQTDKEFTIWFYDVDPTPDNLPASEWTTDELKMEHVEDFYYNREAGHAWRWTKSEEEEGVYYWDDVTDQDTLRALEKASKAQDTADGKRRNFVEQPRDDQAYDVGDTWSNATWVPMYYNDTLVCVTAKAAGEPFSIYHWQAASYATSARIQNLGESIEALVERLTFDKDGNVTNVKQSGVLLEADAATMYTKVDTTNALGERVTAAEAKIETSVQKDADGNLESNAKISADQITMNGAVKFSTKEEVDAAKNEAVDEAQSKAAENTQAKVNALKGLLGELAYRNLVGKALLDETLIEGGYIKSSLIDAATVITSELLAEKIAATDISTSRLNVLEGCKVGNMEIGQNGKMIGSSLNVENVGGTSFITGSFAINTMRNKIQYTRTFCLTPGAEDSQTGIVPVYLPTFSDVYPEWVNAAIFPGYGFELRIIIPVRTGYAAEGVYVELTENKATYHILPYGGDTLYNQDGSSLKYIKMTKGDVLMLYAFCVKPTGGSPSLDYYIMSHSSL